MKPRHQISRAAIELIKRFEGYRQNAAQLPDGRWTIGYGHTQTAREGAEVSEPDAEALLLYDLISVSHFINEWTFTPLTQNQFDALCSFAFNIGLDSFRRSAVLRRINEGAMIQAACAMDLWRKAVFEGEKIVVDALVRRRAAEKALFLTPPDGWTPAPSPILRPSVDMDALEAIPAEPPMALKTPLDGGPTLLERDEPTAPSPFASEEEAPSPAEAAAAAVSSRLAAIFAETDAEEPAAPVVEPRDADEFVPAMEALAVEADEEEAGEAAFVLTAPEEDVRFEPVEEEVEFDPTPEADDPGPTLFDQFDEPGEDALPDFGPPIYTIERRPRRRRRGYLGLLALAMLGLSLAGAAAFWATSVPLSGYGEVFSNPFAIWAVGAAGFLLFLVAAYRMLVRLGRGGRD